MDGLDDECYDLTEDDFEEVGPPARVRCGVDWPLENEADQLLYESRKGVTKVSDKKDFLTPAQLDRRQRREIYTKNGVPESHLVQGIYRRSWNPLAGTRPSKSNSFQDL